jgi:hypothetical protein
MKSIAGSIVVLAAAVLAAGGTTANALTASAGHGGEVGTLAIVAGLGLGIIGLAAFALGLASDRRDPRD